MLINNNARNIISRGILISFAWRLSFVVFFFACAFFLLAQTARAIDRGDWTAIFLGLCGIGCILISACIMAPQIARLLAEPAGKLFYSGEEFSRPQPMFSIPEGKRKSGHYQEAFDGFQKIAEEYPQELKSYIEMINIAIVDMKNKKLADSVFHQGITTLDDKEACDTLLKMYKAISSRLEYMPRRSDSIPFKHHDCNPLG